MLSSEWESFTAGPQLDLLVLVREAMHKKASLPTAKEESLYMY